MGACPNVYPRSFPGAEIGKGSTGFHLKIIVFTAVKNCSTFRGRFAVTRYCGRETTQRL